MYGKFRDNQLQQVDLVKNTETLYYMRDDPGELIGINKTLSSSITIFFEDQQVVDIYYYNQIDGIFIPKRNCLQTRRELKGFNWRGEERLNTVEDLFAGEPAYELVKIQGIPLPEEEESFLKNETG